MMDTSALPAPRPFPHPSDPAAAPSERFDPDPVVTTLPIHLTTTLHPHLHLHQYPLLTRPLQVPPSAAARGRRIRARGKTRAGRWEVVVPVDMRKEVWNWEKGARLGGDAEGERGGEGDAGKEGEEQGAVGEGKPLSDVRMRSEQVPKTGAYMLGVVRDGHLHLHPISETHQFRPSMTYLDTLPHKSKRKSATGASDSDSDDGPPPDPDDPAPVVPIPSSSKKEKKSETREVQVSVRRAGDERAGGGGGVGMGGAGGQGGFQGGLSAVRREMLHAMRVEEEEVWVDYEFCDGEAPTSNDAFEAVFSRESERLECTTEMTALLKDIKGL